MEELNNLKYIKLFSILLLIYAFIGGFLFDVPALPILNESIRVLYFHVPMWFTMIFLLLLSSINSFYFISRKKIIYDTKSYTYTSVAVFFGFLGITSGMIWAKFTWGSFWTNDPKLNGSAITLLIYLSYFLSFFLNIQVEMADAFRSDGKIYVVVLVALIILVGIFFYLFRIEGKIKDINKNK